MSYTPQVGDRVKRSRWGDDEWVDVAYVGRQWFIGDDELGIENSCSLDGGWVKVERRPELPEMPERWAVIHDAQYGAHTSTPYYDSPEHARRQQDGIMARQSHPADLAYVKYVPDMDSIVWADGVQS